ncbi:hypothetical protein [Phenylobacterium sp.]|uniref:hypothetical protein n=1 Tax=Phenylobacterium sp. TaxID=1871053 RepID=UPI002732DAD2|nr:hypothetical protein [Phenylobacterium sp.]MDP3855150.1 hypothetical protein [Phenylobacterium sp.]
MTLRPLPGLQAARLEDAPRYPGCVLRLACRACGWERGYDVGKIINRLHHLRDGGFTTPVADVARSVKRPCPKCKGKDWVTEFAYPERLDEREAKRLAGRYRN